MIKSIVLVYKRHVYISFAISQQLFRKWKFHHCHAGLDVKQYASSAALQNTSMSKSSCLKRCMLLLAIEFDFEGIAIDFLYSFLCKYMAQDAWDKPLSSGRPTHTCKTRQVYSILAFLSYLIIDRFPLYIQGAKWVRYASNHSSAHVASRYNNATYRCLVLVPFSIHEGKAIFKEKRTVWWDKWKICLLLSALQAGSHPTVPPAYRRASNMQHKTNQCRALTTFTNRINREFLTNVKTVSCMIKSFCGSNVRCCFLYYAVTRIKQWLVLVVAVHELLLALHEQGEQFTVVSTIARSLRQFNFDQKHRIWSHCR